MTRVKIDDMTTLTLMDNDNHNAAVAVMVTNGMECATKPGYVNNATGMHTKSQRGACQELQQIDVT